MFVLFPASTLPSLKNAFEPEIAIPPPQSTLPCKVVTPDTFKDDIHVVLWFNVVNPDTFNDDNNVVSLFNVVKPLTFSIYNTEVLFFYF